MQLSFICFYVSILEASSTTLFNFFVNGKSKIPAIKAAITLIAKNTALLSNLSQKPARIADIFPPNDVVINHPPIINAVNLRGATFDVSDKPTGLTNNSLIVKTP